MAHLVDTNIALRLTDSYDPSYRLIISAIEALTAHSEALYYTQQTRREFWNVSTRPTSANGRGLTTSEVVEALEVVENYLVYLARYPRDWPRMGSSGAAVRRGWPGGA
jgi:predicted nucleic acid-binding protein